MVPVMVVRRSWNDALRLVQPEVIALRPSSVLQWLHHSGLVFRLVSLSVAAVTVLVLHGPRLTDLLIESSTVLL